MPPKKVQEPEKKPLIGRVGTNLRVGIVGVPNVGKSTFFNVLTKSAVAAENFPFCTIDPNENKIMTDFYIQENSDIKDYTCDQCVIIKKRFLSFISGEKYKEKVEQPLLSIESYCACNSYYAYLEDTDALERATNLFPPTTSFESIKSLFVDEKYGDGDPYSERGAQLRFLSSRPVSFIILGKPGIGEKEVGRYLADHWGCVYIHPETLIEEEISSGSRAGQCIEFNMRCGRAIGIDIILRLVEKRTRSKSAQHKGFVICGFPLVANDLYEEDPVSSESAIFNVQEIFEEIFDTTIDVGVPPVKMQVSKTSKFTEEDEDAAAEEPPDIPEVKEQLLPKEPVDVGSTTEKICAPPEISLNYEEQINFLFSLLSQPFLVIYVSCPNVDVISKRENSRFNILLNESVNLLREQNPEALYTIFAKEPTTIDEVPEDFTELSPQPISVDYKQLQYYLRVPRDFRPCIAAQLENYRFNAMPTMERNILKHDPQYIIKLDGRISPFRMFSGIKMKLKYLPLQKVVIPQRFGLVREIIGGEGAEIEEIDVEGMTPEDFFREFNAKEIVNRMFKYSWSDWGDTCPVSMVKGTYLRGLPKYAVHFMNKIFFLSDEEACTKFLRNPRPFLSHPYPRPSCRIMIMGPSFSGKTALSKALSYLLNGTVLNPDDMLKEFLKKKLNETLEKVRSDAITEIMARIEMEHEMELKEYENQLLLIPEWKEDCLQIIQEYAHLKRQLPIPNLQEISSLPVESIQLEEEYMQDFEDILIRLAELENSLINEGLECAIDLEQCDTFCENPDSLEEYLPERFRFQIKEYTPPTVFDPVVTEYADAAVKNYEYDYVPPTNEEIIEIYKNAIQEVEDMNEAEGNGRGGWIIDGFVPNEEIIKELGSYFGDEIFVLVDESENYDFLTQRLKNKGEHEFRNFRQFFLNINNVEAAFRAPVESTVSYKEHMAQCILENILEDLPAADNVSEEEVTGEEDIEKTVEEYFKTRPRRSELEAHRNKIIDFYNSFESIKPILQEMNVKINNINVNSKSVERILIEGVHILQERYSQKPRVLTPEDRERELEDFGEPTEGGFGAEEAEEEKEVKEDVFFENRRYGDTYYYCPVAFNDHWVLWKGKEEFGVQYENKLYFMCKESAMKRFIENPKNFLIKHQAPEEFPPPRICIVGPTGSGRTTISKGLAQNYGLYCPDFDNLLKYGDVFLGRYSTIIPSNIDSDTINSYLKVGTPLPEKSLLNLLGKFWFKEPKKSTGFVLDGFPKRPTDVDFMVNNFLVPDVVIELSVLPEIVHDRIVKQSVEVWKQRAEKEKLKKSLEFGEKYSKWSNEREAKFRELMEIKRQERYSRKLSETGQNVESQRVLEDLKEVDEEMLTEEERDIPVKAQVSYDSVIEEADAREVNVYLDEIMPEPEFEEVEESLEEVTEKIMSSAGENYISDLEFIKNIRENCENELIPWVIVDANMSLEKVLVQCFRACDKFRFRNESLFERCYDVSLEIAEKLLDSGYYFLSKFGRFCPVQYYDQFNPIQVFSPLEEKYEIFPILHRQYIYFLAGSKNRSKFKENPLNYTNVQNVNIFLLPFKAAVIGPPKSGKTTLAERFRRDLGLKYISVGKSVRYVLKYLPNSQLAEQVEKVLRKGLELNTELVAKCVEAMTFDGRCNTQGFVLDGFPNIRQEVRYLAMFGLVPHLVIDLQAKESDIFLFLSKDKGKRNIPVFSHDLIDYRYGEWSKNCVEFRSWLDREYQILAKISVYPCKWGVWNSAYELATAVFSEVLYYYKNVRNDVVLRLANMQVSPLEFLERKGGYKHFCPCCMHYENRMNSSGDPPDRTGLVQYKTKYYWICDQHINEFVESPEQFLSPYNKNSLPRELPSQLHLTEKPENSHENGLCIICYTDNLPDRQLNEGKIEYAVNYLDKIYLFDSQECMKKFLSQPQTYFKKTISMQTGPTYPSCLPKELPVLGFLEQYDAQQVIKAVTNTAFLRPVVPGLSTTLSAVINIGLQLKIKNPKTSKNLLQYYIDAKERMLEKHLTLIENLKKYKENINPYLYYDEILDEFEEPEFYRRIMNMNKVQPSPSKVCIRGDGDSRLTAANVINELLNRINYD